MNLPAHEQAVTGVIIAHTMGVFMLKLASTLLAALCLLGTGATAEEALPRYPAVKIMVVVPEFHRGGFGILTGDLLSKVTWFFEAHHAAIPSCETQLTQRFVEAGYKVVDAVQFAALRYTAEMEQVVKDPTGPKARSLAAIYGADVLVVGQCTAEIAGRVDNTISARAAVTLKAVTCRGEALVLGATDATGSGADIGEEAAGLIASHKAADLAADYLLPRLGTHVGGPTTPAKPAAPDNAAVHEGKQRLAVLPFEDRSQWSLANWNLGMQVPDLIANELLKTGRYEVVERNNFTQIVRQQGLQQSGLFDGAGMKEQLGTLLKADYAVVGRITEFSTTKRTGLAVIQHYDTGLGVEDAQINILIKVIDLKTGLITAMHEAHGQATAAIVGVSYIGMVFGCEQFDKTAAGRAIRKGIAEATRVALGGLSLTCLHCRKQLTGNDRFCPACGTKVEVVPAGCPKCHTPNEPGDKFCRQCGAKLGK